MKENKQYGINAEEELMKIMQKEINKSDNEIYEEIKDKAEDFVKICNNNLDFLYEYLISPYQGIRFSNIAAAKYIKDVYNDDYYLRREQLRCEEYNRNRKNKL